MAFLGVESVAGRQWGFVWLVRHGRDTGETLVMTSGNASAVFPPILGLKRKEIRRQKLPGWPKFGFLEEMLPPEEVTS